MTTTASSRMVSALAIAIAALVLTGSDSFTQADGLGGLKPHHAVPSLEPKPLFTSVSGTVQTADRDPERQALRRGTLKVLEPLAQEAILDAEAHVLNLFDDVEIVAFRSRVERHTGRSHSWFGYIPGDEYGRAIVTVVNGTLGVLVTHHARRYVVLPIADSLYEVLEIDHGSFPETDDNLDSRPITRDGGITTRGTRDTREIGLRAIDVDQKIRTLSRQFAATNGNVPRYGPVADDGSVIDVMVVYTHEASCRVDPFTCGLSSNMQVRIQLAIDETNQSFVDSLVQTQLNLVYQGEISRFQYVEHPLMEVNLDAAIDGLIPGLHQLREDWAADIVLLVTAGQAGLAGMTRGRREADDFATHASQAFMVVKASRLGTGWVFAHELGHQLGTDHDWLTIIHRGDGTFVDTQAHGYNLILPGPMPLVKRTIMTYNTYCFLQPEEGGLGIPKDQRSTLCPPIMRWSNRNQELDNLPLGGVVEEIKPILQEADEVPELNVNRVEVSNYRLAACRALSIC